MKAYLKKVLIIGYLHPLTERQMGSFRILPLAKYLTQFGWHPIVLTTPLKEKTNFEFKVIEAPCADSLGSMGKLLGLKPNVDPREQLGKRLRTGSGNHLLSFIFTRVGEIINYPDTEKKWFQPAIKAAKELLEHEHIDVIMSCHPKMSHIIAHDLTKQYQIPWIADLPDLWSQNHNYYYSSLRKYFDKRLEIKTLSRVNALVTVSEPWAEELRILHKNKPVHSITHGFDPDELNLPSAPLTKNFTITYTGSIYHGKQNPTKLLAALKSLINENNVTANDIEVRFYGSLMTWLNQEIKAYNLSGIVQQYGIVDRTTAMEKQRESQLLLLLDWDNHQEKGVYPAKVFEYLAARRPVLTTGGISGNVIDVLLNETKSGKHAITTEETKDLLRSFYQEYKSTGMVAYNGQEKEINKYTQQEMASKFANIFDELIK